MDSVARVGFNGRVFLAQVTEEKLREWADDKADYRYYTGAGAITTEKSIQNLCPICNQPLRECWDNLRKKRLTQ